MGGKYIGTMATGMVLGVAASLMVLPQMDARTRRRICRASRKFSNSAENLMHDLADR